MEFPTLEILVAIYRLLPGLLASTVFYALTRARRPDLVDRVAHALVFTLLVYGAVRATLWCVGVPPGSTGPGSTPEGSTLPNGPVSLMDFFFSVLFAVLLGLALAWSANNDWPLKHLRAWGITSRTTYPSEWYSAFTRHKCMVILHLSGERRLTGWPEEWPDDPESGHFVIESPAWVLDDGTTSIPEGVSRTVVPVSDVQLVEFLQRDDALTEDDGQS